MVMFIKKDPADLNVNRLGRRGRVSYPLLKSFMEANIKLAEVDLEGLDRNPTYLRSVLAAYINSHRLPIRLFSAEGKLHMMRLDLDNDGHPDPNYRGVTNIENAPRVVPGLDDEDGDRPTEGAAGHLRAIESRPINAAEVEKRFMKEKGQVTK
jgi:hypothetical protein